MTVVIICFVFMQTHFGRVEIGLNDITVLRFSLCTKKVVPCPCISESPAIECIEHNHDKSKNGNFGIFDKMDVLQNNLAGAQSYYVQSTS